MKRYIAKKDCWFKEGTEAKLIEDLGYGSGIFEGIFVIEEENDFLRDETLRGYKIGDEVIDREVCSFDCFDIMEEETV